MADAHPPGDKALTRADLERLHGEGLLDTASYRYALTLWDESRFWRSFTTRWLTILGAAFLLIGILFFFAYNWKELHRFARFGILQGGVLLTALASAWALRSGTRHLAGELLLIAAAVLTGILIAVYGQAYQTGADAFQNFLAWAALILPWVLAGRSAPLWILWLATLETGIIFFWTQVMGPTGTAGFALLFVLLGLLTFGAALLREFLIRKPAFAWLAHRPIRYLLATATLTWLGISTVRFIFHDEFRAGGGIDILGFLLLVASIGANFWWHRLRDYDLGALLIATLYSATLLVIALVYLLVEDGNWGGAGVWLLMALFTLGIYGGAGFALQQIHRTRKEAPGS